MTPPAPCAHLGAGGSQGTFFQVGCLNRYPRSIIAHEVGNVHVKAPDNPLYPQLDDAPVVTCATETRAARSGETCAPAELKTSNSSPSSHHRKVHTGEAPL